MATTKKLAASDRQATLDRPRDMQEPAGVTAEENCLSNGGLALLAIAMGQIDVVLSGARDIGPRIISLDNYPLVPYNSLGSLWTGEPGFRNSEFGIREEARSSRLAEGTLRGDGTWGDIEARGGRAITTALGRGLPAGGSHDLTRGRRAAWLQIW